VLLLLAWGSAALAIDAESEVEAVTLYRDQALVTRAVRAEVPAGASELVVGDLPQRVLPDSLFANGAGETTVRAVRYRTRALREEPREAIRRLDEQIEGLRDELRANEVGRGLVEERRQYLGKLEQFVAPTAQVELTKGVLNAETLKALTLFIFAERKDLAEELLNLEQQRRELDEQLSLLQRKKAELTAGSTRTLREAVVFVDRAARGPVELSLSYRPTTCGPAVRRPVSRSSTTPPSTR